MYGGDVELHYIEDLTAAPLPPFKMHADTHLVAVNHVANNVQSAEFQIVIAADKKLFQNGVPLTLLLNALAGVRVARKQREPAAGRLAKS
jgi:hypothetical protein